MALSLDTWVSLAALAGGFGLLFGYLRGLRTELKSDIGSLRTEFKSDIGDLRAELKTDIADLRRTVTTLDERVYDLNTSVTALLARDEVRHQP